MQIASFISFFAAVCISWMSCIVFLYTCKKPTHSHKLLSKSNECLFNKNKSAQTIRKLTKRHMTLNLVNKIMIFLFIYVVPSLYNFIYTNLIQVLLHFFRGQTNVNRRVPGPNCMEDESRFFSDVL